MWIETFCSKKNFDPELKPLYHQNTLKSDKLFQSTRKTGKTLGKVQKKLINWTTNIC